MCGLKLNGEKLKLEPMQVGQWLGFVIDTIRMQFKVPSLKIAKLEESRFHHFVARVASLINSLFVAVGPIASLFTWQIHCTIQAQSGWDCSLPNSVPLLEGLRFWFLNIEVFNGYGIQPKFSPGAVIFCDASDYAFGSF